MAGEKNKFSINNLCKVYDKYNQIPKEKFVDYKVKKGLRNSDGSGVLVGVSNICNVKGYIIDDGEYVPVPGILTYRGINIKDILSACEKENRFGFEEVAFLILFGKLPTKSELEEFSKMLGSFRELPQYFVEDMIIKAPSKDLMNKLSRSVLALYSYDENPEGADLENNLRQCIQLIARFPTIAVNAYQVKKRFFDKKSLYFHFPQENLSTAENFLYTMRSDKKFTDEEAKLLDLCLILHMDHGGGNNSTFTTRVLTSTGTDIYSTIAGAVCSLKGPKHGGANNKICQMIEYMKEGIEDWENDEEVLNFLIKILNKEEGDKSGLIYGMGHAVYTVSDPRAVILKEKARELAKIKGMEKELNLIESVERLAPEAMKKVKGERPDICANVDLYSGFVYRMLGLPTELYTPIFAMARIVGWCAHRLEELYTSNKIMRPAYKCICKNKKYIDISERD